MKGKEEGKSEEALHTVARKQEASVAAARPTRPQQVGYSRYDQEQFSKKEEGVHIFEWLLYNYVIMMIYIVCVYTGEQSKLSQKLKIIFRNG